MAIAEHLERPNSKQICHDHPFSWAAMMRFLSTALVGLLGIALAANRSDAREIVSLTDELGILRDFAQIKIAAPDKKNARVFADTARLVVPTLSAEQNAELRQIAVDELGSKLRLIGSKNEANYLVQIRMHQYVNYAIRNQRGETSQGFVMISLCKYPIQNIATDCENLQYDFFQPHKAKDIFSRIFRLWLEATIEQ